MRFLRFSNLYFVLSAFLLGASIFMLFLHGLHFGIDFTGGSILEIIYEANPPSQKEIENKLSELNLGTFQIQEAGEKGFIFRMKDITEDTHAQILQVLGPEARELRFESVGPIIGKELRDKTLLIIAISLFIIVFYITLAFRKITHPVRSWQWSIASFLALLHDLLLPLGALSLFGEFLGIELNIPVVVALLTVVGYSINNNIVVFDRIRENLLKRVGIDFADTVERSIKQTFARNLNTSITTLIPLVMILFFGGKSLEGFAFSLILGIVTGFYSSLFFAPAFLVRTFGR